MPCCSEDTCSSRTPPVGRFRAVLWTVLAINAGMFLAEIGAGLAAGSAALQADALDFFADAANYAISLSVLGLGFAGAPAPLGLSDSHIGEALRASEGEDCAVFEGLELRPSAQDDDRAGFAVVAGPAAEAGADPGGEGEASPRVRVLLAFGPALEVAADDLEEGLVLRIEGVGEGRSARPPAAPSRSAVICRTTVAAIRQARTRRLRGASSAIRRASMSKPLRFMVRKISSIFQRFA